jgi:hypothetical protein
MTRFLTFAFALAVCPLFLSCSGDDAPNGPSQPPPIVNPPPVVSPALTGLSIEGSLTLASVGETTQLRAMARYADGTSVDVSSQAKWFTGMPSAFSVSQGLVEALKLGSATISAQVPPKYVGVRVIATPPGTVTVGGQVREPGQGGGVGLRPNNVRVLEPRSGAWMMTDEDGLFTLGGLTSVRVRFERDDLETVEKDLHSNVFDDVPMQRIVRINAGDTVTPVPLAPFDMAYTMDSGELCFPCRLIRVDLPTSGTLHFGLKWTTATASLALWVNNVRHTRSGSDLGVNADVPLSAGQRLVYVQSLSSGHVSFTLETSYNP